jgi:hypothetical protein
MLIADFPKIIERAPYVFHCKHDPAKKYHFKQFVKPINEVIFHLSKDKEWCNDYRLRDVLVIELMQIKNRLIEIYELEEFEKPSQVPYEERIDF